MKEENHKIAVTVHIFKLVANDVASIFPYFLAFYLVSLFVSLFFTAWRGYFSWPAFTASVVALALITLGSDKAKTFWNGVTEISKRGGNTGFEIVGCGATIVGRGNFLLKKFLAIAFCAVVIPAREKIFFWKKNLGKFGYLKLAAILVILTFSLFRDIYVLDFFVLLFGLVSVFFGLDMRISAGCALVLLAACPILLIFNGNILAEVVAVYAYYFLVIAVFTGITDYMRENHGFLKAG
jgi:hypothetical protein